MKKLMILLLLALSVALFGCGGEKDEVEVKAPEAKSVEVAGAPKMLALEWQRMIDEDGNVCCSSDATRMAVETARAKLAEELEVSGIEVTLLKTDFTPEECMEDPERANRILIAGRGLDYWLQAEIASSPCEGFCKQALGGKGSCQNLIYEGETYEVIPAELIIKAGLAAAANPATFKSAGKCDGCPSKSACPSAISKCDASCKGHCPSCTGEKGACTCKGECDGSCPEKAACTCVGECDGSCRADAATTKATGCPGAKVCGSKVCVVGS